MKNRHLYPRDWKKQAWTCKELAGWQCQACLVRHGTRRVSWSGRLWPVYLVAAHKKHDPFNPSAELVCVCPSCQGTQTIGVYLISESGTCITAAFDADTENGLDLLHGVQERLALSDLASYLEQSRRGGHLWVFLTSPAPASLVRRWLLPYCPDGLEFYPKQNEGKGYGSLIRLPLGVHHRSGKRYPFVHFTPDGYRPVAPSVRASLDWFTTVQRVTIPDPATLAPQQPAPPNKKTSFSLHRLSRDTTTSLTIREWSAQQDPYTLIGRYVDLSTQGIGRCPFGWHHTGGSDTHASFKVYTPGMPGGYCWYCHVWQQGGSVFDFLRYYHHLDARTLWMQLCNGSAHLHTTGLVTRGVPNTNGECLLDRTKGGAYA